MGSNAQRPGQTSARNDVRPGDVLAGKFRVERVVGRGGMGLVIEATNVQLDQRVALKLLATGSSDPAAVDRFSREARAAARLRSEHVARVFDVGRDDAHGPFIVMEMLDGKTLAEVIATTGRVAVQRAIEYVIDACEGLAEAHARGIVHQDVKPGNLFLATGTDGRPTIKLLDFGIALMRSKTTEPDPKSSQTSVGTPAYLAPEQLRGGSAVDHRADIWALGCVLHELLAGQRPFQATRFTALVTQILEEAPAPVPLDVELPAGVADVLRRCLEKDPAKRFATTAELALALLPYARPRAHSAVARAVAQVRTAGLDPHLEMPSSMPPRPSDATEVPPISALRPPRVPTFDDLALESAAPVAAAAASPARPRWIAAVLLVGFALMAFAGVMLMRMAEQPEGRPSSPAATPSPAAAVSIANGDGVANAASAVAESPAVSTPARREASPPPVRTGAPVALPRPAAAPARPSASSAPSDFDIRPTR